MRQGWSGLMAVAEVDGPSLSNSSTPTSLLPPAAKCIIPAYSLGIGRRFRASGVCRLSNIVTTPGTLTLDIRFGAVVAWNGGAMQLSTTVHTTLPLYFEAILTCRAIGNSTNANMMGFGRATSQCLSLTAVADSTTTPATLLLPNTAPAVGTGFDSTVDNEVNFYGAFSIANAGNLIQLHEWAFESLN